MTKTKAKPKPKANKEPSPPPLPLRLEYLDPAELKANPSNWRTHPAAQVTALADAIAEVGWAGALLYNERTQRLIDGHARKDLFAGKGKVPVLVGSWDEGQEKKILATLDPLAAMAGADAEKLDALLRDVQTGSEAVAQMLTDLARESGAIPSRLPTDPANDPAAEWQGMPEFQHEDKTAFRTLTVHFKDQEAVDRFAEVVGQKVTEQTRYLWFPEAEIIRYGDAE